jgi:acetyltransferase-like isoleucine patch superfamily enzyme
MSRLLTRTYNTSIDRFGGGIAALSSKGIERFHFVSELLAQVPFAIGWKLRQAVYRRILPSVGEDVVMLHGVVIDDPRTTLGSNIWVSYGSFIEYAFIEDHVLIGQHVVILAGKNHHNIDRVDIPIKRQGNPPKEPITIGHGVWIGANATVMADVGHDAIVGAGSVVTKPVPPFAIVAGNPARVLRMRTDIGS